MTEYDLPNVTDFAGTFKFRLYSPTAGLTEPTIDTILGIGERREVIDAGVGFGLVESIELAIRDDYSTYTEGFWHKIIGEGDLHIRVALTESTDKTFFYGILDEVHWDELALIDSEYVRVGRLTVLSLARDLLEADTEDWKDEIYSHTATTGITTDGKPYAVVSLGTFFSSLLVSSGLNATFTEGDTSFEFVNGGSNLQWNSGGTDYDLEDLHIATDWYNSVGGTNGVTDYFGTGSECLNAIYPTAGELLKSLLRNIGCTMSMDYDITNDRHLIRVVPISRGFADGEHLVFANESKESTQRLATDLYADSVRFSLAPDSASTFSWMSRVWGQAVTPATSAVPVNLEFDIDVAFLFDAINAATSLPHATLDQTFWVNTGATYVAPGVEYYNHSTGSYASITTGLLAYTPYYFFLFSVVKRAYIRLYSRLTASDGSTTSFRHLVAGRRTSIDDGSGAAVYRANMVSLIPDTQETEIEWIEE